MSDRESESGRVMVIALTIATVTLLPLAGALQAGYPLSAFLRVPPSDLRLAPASISLPAHIAYWSVAFAIGILLWRQRRPSGTPPLRGTQRRSPLPAWGWLGIAWTLIWWAIAWDLVPRTGTLRPFTFFPLWLGYVIIMQALATRNLGRPPFLQDPIRFLALFAVSALFWWYFEMTNRIVGNWEYRGIKQWSPGVYAVHATVCFSTVLPAVASTVSWLQSSGRIRSILERYPEIPWPPGRLANSAVLAASATGLLLLGDHPDWFFPLLWTGPLITCLALSRIFRTRIPEVIAPGQPSLSGKLWFWAFAALTCGFFWELWNAHSLARWVYHIPYLDGPRLFAMPITGYLGYLPFGIECAIASAFLGASGNSPAQ